MAGFIGRARELNVLSGLVARQGGPGVAVIFGEPGSGKTRLLSEARCRLPFEAYFSMAGFEPERQVPLAAASSLLRELARVGPIGAELRALFSASSAEMGTLEPIRIFEATHLALATVQPVLLSLDDLQWADELSLALCHYLVRAAAYAGDDMTLIAASRPTEAATAFANSMEQVAPGRATTIELGPLSREEGVELAAGLAPSLEQASLELIWERAQGSPFWIEALVDAEGSIDASALVTRRLRGASGDSASLLALLAVAGRPLTLDEAATLQRWPPDRVGSAVAQLTSRGLAMESGGALRLAHDLMREAAFRDLPDESRRALHRRLAEWLEAGASYDPGELRAALEHRRLGGLPTTQLALRLAQAPRRALLGRDVLTLLIAIVDESDPSDDDEASELEEAVASLAFDLADYRVAFERWGTVAERSPDPTDRAAALVRAARAACLAECPEEARAFLARARDLRFEDPVLALELETAELFVETWIGPITREMLASGPRVGATARALAEAHGGFDRLGARARRTCLDALDQEKTGAIVQGKLHAAIAVCDDIVAAARGFDEEVALSAQARKQYAVMSLGRLAEAELELRRIWLEARRRAMPKVAIDAGYWLLGVLEDRARIHDAVAIASEVGELAARLGDPVELRLVSHQRRRLGLLGAHWERARRQIEEAVPDEPYEHQRLQYHAALAIFTARLGGSSLTSAALDYRAKADADAAVAGCLRCLTERDLEGAEILARAGRVEEARACLASWDAKRPDPGGLDALSRRRTDALLAALEGESEHAVEALENLQAESERIDALLFTLWTSLDLARVLTETDRTRSADILRNTSERAELLGVTALSELAEKRLRALGVRTWRRRGGAPARSGLDALSDREREIARLAASGASNPEIAQAVFLSRKTVERHLSSIFAKLGVRNRTELAAQLVSHTTERADTTGIRLD